MSQDAGETEKFACRNPRPVVYTDYGIPTAKLVPCGNWRLCRPCALLRVSHLKHKANSEVLAVRQALNGRDATSILVTYTIDGTKAPRYGNEARFLLSEKRDLVHREIKRIIERRGLTLITHVSCFELHKDAAIHGHTAYIIAGRACLNQSSFARLGTRDIPTGRLMGYGLYEIGSLHITIRYHSAESISSAIRYAVKYVIKSTDEDWRLVNIKLSAHDCTDGYKGTRWLEFSRCKLQRLRRRLNGYRPRRKVAGIKQHLPILLYTRRDIFTVYQRKLIRINGVVPPYVLTFNSQEEAREYSDYHPESTITNADFIAAHEGLQVFTMTRRHTHLEDYSKYPPEAPGGRLDEHKSICAKSNDAISSFERLCTLFRATEIPVTTADRLSFNGGRQQELVSIPSRTTFTRGVINARNLVSGDYLRRMLNDPYYNRKPCNHPRVITAGLTAQNVPIPSKQSAGDYPTNGELVLDSRGEFKNRRIYQGNLFEYEEHRY